MAAPKAAHHAGFAVDRSGRDINARPVVIVGGREDEVAVACQNRIDSVNACQRNCRVFHALGFVGFADTRMAKRDDNVCALLFHLWNICAGGCDDIAGLHVAF